MSRGFTLTEAAVAMAIAALAIAALVPVLSGSARVSARANSPVHAALAAYATSLARDAAQAWKYGVPGNVAAQPYAATLSAADGSALQVRITQTFAAVDASSSQVTVTVASGNDSVSASAHVAVRAPLPGSQVARPGLVPAPSGTP